jgi:hypothetical protein
MWETILQYWWVILIILIVPPIIKGLNSPRAPKPPGQSFFTKMNMSAPIKKAADYTDEELLKLALTDQIAAIKLYREKTGVGLKEAKEYIDLMILEHLDKQ